MYENTTMKPIVHEYDMLIKIKTYIHSNIHALLFRPTILKGRNKNGHQLMNK